MAIRTVWLFCLALSALSLPAEPILKPEKKTILLRPLEQKELRWFRENLVDGPIGSASP
ncbi:MAG: hypothetical protein ACO3ZW_05430 [Opitutales bacterium]